MTGPARRPAYPRWDRVPANIPDKMLLLWYQTALGVLLLNASPGAADEAAHQADKVLERHVDPITR